MDKNAFLAMGLLAVLQAAGCQPKGWVIKPAPVDETLQERVIYRDEGLFVSDKIAVIDVDGVLLNQRQAGLLGWGENPVSLFIEKMDAAQSDPAVKAMVLRINSPGGGVTASDIMHHRLMQFRAARKAPVVAVIEDVGASGGYYLACGAERIVAHPTSVTGSIGVIVQTVSFAGTMRMIGVDAKAVTSGPRKDLASPLKPLDKEDLKIIQGMVNDFHERFIAVVDGGRPELSAEQVRALADGRVYTGQQAQANGLVDDLGYVMDAIRQAKRLSGSERVKVVMYARPLGHRANAYSRDQAPAPQVNFLNVNVPSLLDMTRPRLLYLWTGQTAGR